MQLAIYYSRSTIDSKTSKKT